jgi:hypothetical protein
MYNLSFRFIKMMGRLSNLTAKKIDQPLYPVKIAVGYYLG